MKVAADSFRPNPKLKTERVITELGKGEALVSFLEGNGVPAMVDRCLIRPPSARVGPVTVEERRAVIARSPVKGQYETVADRESASRFSRSAIQEAADPTPRPPAAAAQDQAPAEETGGVGGWLGGISHHSQARPALSTANTSPASHRTVVNRMAGHVAADLGRGLGGKMGGSIGRALVRGALGGILRR